MRRLGLILFMIATELAGAHPLGIFSLNRYAKIELDGGVIRVIYVVDIAEIPAIREFTEIDENNDDVADEGERARYSARKGSQVTGQFHLYVDGNELIPKLTRHDLSFPEGQGGLRTIRLEQTLENQIETDDKPHRLKFADENYHDRIGWKEIVVHAGSGSQLIESSVPQEDLSGELRSYPVDRIGNPLTVSEANVQYRLSRPGEASRSGSSVIAIIERTRDGFAELISTKELSMSVAFLSLILALILGAGHALTPGHGKTIVAAYLVGQRGTARHAVLLGLTVTLTHTIGVFAMGLIALFASNFILPEKLFPWLGCISGFTVVVIGVLLLKRRWTSARELASGIETSEHEHVHSHGGKAHSHLPHAGDGSPVSMRSLLALGVSGGLLPCPSAIVVLLSAIALGRIGFGLLLIIAFSIGLAGVLTGIGLLMVYARKMFEKFNTQGVLARWLPVVSAGAVTTAGVVLTLQSFGQTGISITSILGINGLSLQGIVGAGSYSVLALGFVLGIKHALDADHLIAVSTIVSEREGFWSSSIIGALWGLGHTASLLIVGMIVIAFHFTIPDKIAQLMEFSVALMLIFLGINVLRKIRGGAKLHHHIHRHETHAHLHPHLHEQSQVHPVADSVHHHGPKIGKKPFFVGMVHGMAGSAALMLVVLAAISSRALAFLYIGLFGLGSVGGMFLMSALIGLPFAFTSRHDKLNMIIRTCAGTISLGFGVFYGWQIGFVGGLFP